MTSKAGMSNDAFGDPVEINAPITNPIDPRLPIIALLIRVNPLIFPKQTLSAASLYAAGS